MRYYKPVYMLIVLFLLAPITYASKWPSPPKPAPQPWMLDIENTNQITTTNKNSNLNKNKNENENWNLNIVKQGDIANSLLVEGTEIDNQVLVEGSSIANDVLVEGSTFLGGDNIMNAAPIDIYNGGTNINMAQPINFVDAAPAYITIDGTSVPVPQLSGGITRSGRQGRLDHGWAAGITVTIPITLGLGTTSLDNAIEIQQYKFKTFKLVEARTVERHTLEIAQMKETHQGEMMSMCLVLHEQGFIHPGQSNELFARCEMYEHHKPDPEPGPGEPGYHDGNCNPRQVSSHPSCQKK